MLVRKACDQLRNDILDQAKEHRASKSVQLPPETESPESLSEPEPEPVSESTEPVVKVKRTRKPKQPKA